jgi:hypothetical protein
MSGGYGGASQGQIILTDDVSLGIFIVRYRVVSQRQMPCSGFTYPSDHHFPQEHLRRLVSGEFLSFGGISEG